MHKKTFWHKNLCLPSEQYIYTVIEIPAGFDLWKNNLNYFFTSKLLKL